MAGHIAIADTNAQHISNYCLLLQRAGTAACVVALYAKTQLEEASPFHTVTDCIITASIASATIGYFVGGAAQTIRDEIDHLAEELITAKEQEATSPTWTMSSTSTEENKD